MRTLAALNEIHVLLDQQETERKAKALSKPPVKAKRKKYRCADCTYVCKWPGELADHRRLRHGDIT